MHRRRCLRHLDTGIDRRTLNGKQCALARDRAHLDPVIQDVSQPLHDRKTQPKAAPRRAVGPLIVLMEYVRELVFGGYRRHCPRLQCDTLSPARGILAGIRPLSVYRTAFDNRFADQSPRACAVAADDELERTMHSRSLFPAQGRRSLQRAARKISFSENSLTDEAGFPIPAVHVEQALRGCWSWCPRTARIQRQDCVPHRLGGAAQALPAGFRVCNGCRKSWLAAARKLDFGAIGQFCCFHASESSSSKRLRSVHP